MAALVLRVVRPLSFKDAHMTSRQVDDVVLSAHERYCAALLCRRIFRAGQRASRGHSQYGMYIVPRAATGWPPDGGGGSRHMKDGLFRKIMNFIGQGGKAIE